LTIKNEKSESSRTSEVFGHKNWGQIHLTLSFGPKSSLGFVPCFGQIGGFYICFQQLYG
jgi:hypothetical protein